MPAPGLNGLVEVEVELQHACGLQVDGSATCSGTNQSGSTNPVNSPFAELQSDQYYTCGLRLTDNVLCWGSSPIGPPVGGFQRIDGDYDDLCGVDDRDQAGCWGSNGSGQQEVPVCIP